MKPLTEEQRAKLLRKVSLWMTLHHDDVNDIFNSTCQELKCAHVNLCGFGGDHSPKPTVEFFFDFFFPSINPHICFGWLYPDKLEK